MPSFFSKQLLQWHNSHPRPLPWDNGPRDPYHIWISEIIMQQTRIEQGTPFYLNFIHRFPDVHALARASVDEVLRYWQGLGYYSRARNLHKAAQFIVEQNQGRFPDAYASLLDLPGVGPYSAAAIASFAYGLPYPVVDGNVKRVIARFGGLTTSIDDTSTHEEIRATASTYMKGVSPAEFNQAIMNFGALVCKPKHPDCISCTLRSKCVARKQKMTDILPVRSKKKTNELRYFHFFILHWKGKFLLQRREGKDIWRGLYAPPIIENKNKNKPTRIQLDTFMIHTIGHTAYEVISSSVSQQQILSHQTITGRFHEIRLLAPPGKKSEHAAWVNQTTIHEYGKPKIVVDMLERQAL